MNTSICRMLATAFTMGVMATGHAQIWENATRGGIRTADATQTIESPTGTPFIPPPGTPSGSSANSDGEAKAAVAANRAAVPPMAAAGTPPVWNIAPPETEAPALEVVPVAARTQPNSQTPVWTVGSAESRTSALPHNGERRPYEFGTGWRNFMSQKLTGSPAAMIPTTPAGSPSAATIATARITPATPTARSEWSWQGYDAYNQSESPSSIAMKSESMPGMHPDMAPYMKYSHLWRSSNNGFAQPVTVPDSQSPAATSAPPPTLSSSAWQPGPASPPTAFAVAAPPPTAFAVATPSPSPIQPTGFAIASNATGTLPQRPSDLPASPPPPSPPPASAGQNPGSNPIGLRERIADACAGKVRNLAIESLSVNRLRIAFLVRQQADAEALTERLARLPELAPYKIDFEVQIAPTPQ